MTSEDLQQRTYHRPGDGELRLRVLLDAAGDAFFLYDEAGRILDVNLRALDSLGYTRDELLRMHMHEVEVSMSNEGAAALWAKLEPGEAQTLQGTLRRKDDTTFPTEIKLGVINYLPGGKQFVAFARDMTMHQRADKARDVFSSLGQKLSAISTLRDAGLVILNAADDLFRWDTAFIELYDSKSDTLLNIAAFDEINGVRSEVRQMHNSPAQGSNTEKALKDGPQLILRRHPETASTTSQMYGDVARPSASLMYVPIRKDNHPIGLVSVQAYRLSAYDQQDLHLLESLAEYCSGAFDRTLVHERLREAEQRFTTAFDHAPIGLGLLKPDGDWIRVNHSLCQIVGYTERELLSTGLHGITFYDDLSKSLDSLLSVFSGDQNFVTFETRLIHRSNRNVWVSFRASLVRDTTGQPIYLIAQIQDITTQRHYERLQAALRDLGRKLVEATTQKEVAQLTLATAEYLLGWDAAFVDVFDPETNAFSPVVLVDTIDGHKHEVPNIAFEIEVGTNAHRTLQEGALLIQRESTNQTTDYPFGSSRPSASLMYVPIRLEGKHVGVLSIQSYRHNQYTQDDLHTLQELADYCSNAFERAYAETKAAEAQRALRINQERFDWVMRATTDVIYDWDMRSGELWWNTNLGTMFGYSFDQKVNRVEWWQQHVHPEDRDSIMADMNEAIQAGHHHWSGEYRFLNSDGSYAVVFDRGHVIYEDGVATRMIGSMMDITQRKLAEEELRHGAYHDPLTGLPNRVYLLQELERGLVRGRRRDRNMLGVLFLDLDGFKEVNDRLGHAAGDQLLIEVAHVLRDCVRPSDFVSRLAGDEFTIILHDLSSSSAATFVATRILQRLQHPIQLRAGDAQTSASIGIALCSNCEVTGDELLQQADQAMYKAKEGGKNRYEFYSPPAN